jgi:hypothetical protein
MYVTDCKLFAVQCLLGASTQVISSRIIIDPHTFNIYGMPGPNLESIDSGPPTTLANENIIYGTHNVIYKATSQAFLAYQKALGKYERYRKKNLSVQRKPASYLITTLTV